MVLINTNISLGSTNQIGLTEIQLFDEISNQILPNSIKLLEQVNFAKPLNNLINNNYLTTKEEYMWISIYKILPITI